MIRRAVEDLHALDLRVTEDADLQAAVEFLDACRRHPVAHVGGPQVGLHRGARDDRGDLFGAVECARFDLPLEDVGQRRRENHERDDAHDAEAGEQRPT